ncbi:MAG: TlpA family protein disulfide reductase [Chitinophagaceae bacterium]|nr:TlpA family protein disulfide reductase [Chitinophagaceae bacterium]MCW5925589.1 TlpA family protein disulfide reductase [Chitinophagaceae bacterium]
MQVKLVLAIVLCGPFIHASGQSVKPLNIGDTLTNTEFTYYINDQKHTGSLPDKNGKLTILDFWATWCTSCIKALPKVEALQHEMGEKVQFILVNAKRTKDDSLKTRNFFVKWKERYGTTLNLPSIEQDTLFGSLFPHHVVPHYVWIDGNGKVVATTSAEQLTAANINSVLEKEQTEITMKKDQDRSRPLFTNNDLPRSRLLSYRLFLKGGFDGLPSGNRLHQAGDTLYGRGITNMPLKDMYLTILREIYPHFKENRIVLEVKDPSKWKEPAAEHERDIWYKENMYSLELILPVQQAPLLYDEMLQELNRSSGFIGNIECRNIPCFVLTRTGKSNQLKSRGGETKIRLFYVDHAYLENAPLQYLIGRLNNCPAIAIPVVDETGIDFPVDMDFPEGFSDREKIARQLRQYRLALEKTERELEVFVIKGQE